MDDALLLHRFHFAFTITYHYLFPQLTMGLGLLIVLFKALGIRKNVELYNRAAKFWAKIFAVNFTVGVVTGIPMEFQFGTGWARFSTFAGGVIGQTLAMEGMFAFFLESSFLGLFIFGEKKLGKIGHLVAAIAVWLGSWISGLFIVATNAWMQHPVAYEKMADGTVRLIDFWGLFTNPWFAWQYLHTMAGAVATGSFVVAAVGAYYLLSHRDEEYGKLFIRTGVLTALVTSLFLAFPSGDAQAKNIVAYQPPTLAAMEGLFDTKEGAGMTLFGQPDMEKLTIDNPIHVPYLLSLLAYNQWNAEVKGLKAFPRDQWPTNVPLLFYSYHIMISLGSLFIGVMLLSVFLLWKKKLFSARWALWILLLSFPLPYIANTAGWMSAEMGRQPWLVYGLMRTVEGFSPLVSAGNALFTLIGFIGMYLLIGVLFLFMVAKKIKAGPEK
jgi:cytochrome d ubiquinol oxidase subunit I